jgi:hypothetical protein
MTLTLKLTDEEFESLKAGKPVSRELQRPPLEDPVQLLEKFPDKVTLVRAKFII